MQNIQECLTGLWPATGASSRCTARFAVSISASHVGIDDVRRHGEGNRQNGFFKKKHGFSARCPAFFFSET